MLRSKSSPSPHPTWKNHLKTVYTSLESQDLNTCREHYARF